MAKFNQPNVPTPPRQPDAITAQGGLGFSRDVRDELFVLGLANMVGEDTFYESGKSRDTRFVDLIHKATNEFPDWTRAFIGWMRGEGNMRSASIVAAAEYVAAGGPGGRQVVSSVLLRPDEPGELLGYWGTRLGGKAKRPPKAVARGIADALPRLYTERNTLKYDGQGHAIRFGDVIEITHASGGPLFRYLIDRRHGREDRLTEYGLETLIADRRLMALPTDQRRAHLGDAIEAGWAWERIAGWVPGGMDAEAWAAAIPNMGAMALVRNLRNFDEANLTGPVIEVVQAKLRDHDEIRKSRQFPLRFLSAWKNVASVRWGDALETALNHSLSNVPSLSGRTLVLVDVSGSMKDFALSRSRGTGLKPERWEIASVFAIALAQRAESADVILFNNAPVAKLEVAKMESVLRLTEACQRYVGGGTNIIGSLLASYANHDQVVILTDEQAGNFGGFGRSAYDHSGAGAIKVPVITFNLAGYKTGVTANERNWLTVGSLSDAAFKAIPAFVNHYGNRKWPWEVPAEDR